MKFLVNKVKLKRNNFNNALDNYIDIANMELLEAEEELNNYIREAKSNERKAI